MAEVLTLTIKELAKRLGISERTIRRRVETRELPRPIRLGRKLLWRVAEIKAWVVAGMPKVDQWTWEAGN